ncbi:glycosyltransferase [bacterium]|nr:glycosyltransferase [bacterium]
MVDNKKNLLFLSYGEDIFQNPILQNQFIQFAENFDKQKFNIHIYSFMPVSRKRLFENKIWNEQKIALTNRLKQKNISFTINTLPVLASWLYSNVLQFFLFHTPWQQIKLAWYIRRHRIHFVSARSYHAGFMALRVRQLFCMSFKIHFDPRSLFVEEGQLLKKIRGLSLWMWNRIERFIYQKADLVTFVSEPFLEVQNQKYKIKKSLLIYTHVDIEKIKFVVNKPLSPLRFCYLGQLDHTGWHRIQNLFDLFAVLQKEFPDCHLRIITKSDPIPIRQEQEKRNLKNVEITTSSSISETSQLMENCHFGILSYKNIHSPIEERIAKTVVASKSGEYLAAGLPLICQSQVYGISKVIEKYKTGVSYGPNQENNAAVWVKSNLSDYVNLAQTCRQQAQQLFSLHTHIKPLEKEVDTLCAQ